MPSPADLLREMWQAAIMAAQPAACLPGHWPTPPTGRLAVIACGKAAVPMAAAAVAHYGSGCGGVVIQPRDPVGPARAIPGFRHFQASHPVPDECSMAAARAALELASGLAADDLLLVLLSGGGSALMSLPAAGVSLAEKQSLSRQLLTSGATIQELNCMRKQLSRIKGGRLAGASRAPVVTLALSDVPGDDPALIASGPTVSDSSTPEVAREILARYKIKVTAGIHEALRRQRNEAPVNPGLLARDRYRIVASCRTALEAAATCCRGYGIEPLNLGDDLQGEARELAREHARLALDLAGSKKAACLLSGGETTVRLRGRPGLGGPNTEYALALALALSGQADTWALAADTDGIDGFGGQSGALVDPGILRRAREMGLDAAELLERHDSATFFARAGGLLTEGPTGTNVNDFRAILVQP